MANVDREPSVYVKVTDYRKGVSKNVTVRGVSQSRLLRFIKLAVRTGLDECEEAVRQIPRHRKRGAA